MPKSSGTVGDSPEPLALDTSSAARNTPSVDSATRVRPNPGDLKKGKVNVKDVSGGGQAMHKNVTTAVQGKEYPPECVDNSEPGRGTHLS